MKNISRLIWSLVLLISIGSCSKKDVVDLDPIDQIPAEEAIRTFADLTSAVNGVYGTWLARRDVFLSAFLTDEARLGTGSGYRNIGNILFNYQYVSDSQDFRDDEQGGVWTNLYAVIDRANRVLELMGDVPATTPAQVSLKEQYRGEMLALRGMAHFNLLRWYASTAEYTPSGLGVPVSSSYIKAPGATFPKRNTQQEVINSVQSDLTDARNLIPASFTDISRVTRNAVLASEARVAQHIKDWQTVIDRATPVLTSQPISNISNYPAIWTTRNLAANQSTEVIWKLNVQVANLAAAVGSLFQDLNSAIQASPSLKLRNSYDSTADIRFPTFFRTTVNPPILVKYGGVFNNNGENFQYDIKMIRSSEILLARAEAYAELNQISQANDDLSTLRSNRIAGYVHTPITDKATLIAEILLERFRELAFEGQRYHDLRRRSLPIQRDISDVAGNASIQTLLPTSSKYLLPIPQQEVFANNNIQQNPGY